MSDEYDPRARRLNTGIQELVDILDEHWRALLAETDYLERKGKLRVVRGIIDQIIDQPEWLEPDLRNGAVDEVSCWFGPQEFAGEPAPVFLDERPFDNPGPSSGLCFFYTDTGKASPLYEGEPMDPFIGPLRNHGPYVYTLEKHYATEVETVARVMSGNLWRQLLPGGETAFGAPDTESFFLICDPRGLGGGEQALHFATFDDAERAVDVVESLSERIGVRLLVARVRRRWCTH
jgi:hypothetical protein